MNVHSIFVKLAVPRRLPRRATPEGGRRMRGLRQSPPSTAATPASGAGYSRRSTATRAWNVLP
jgi:hypothetical protein